MIDEFPRAPAKPDPDKFLPALGIFTAWRLHVYGYAIAAVYAAFLIAVYRAGTWLVDGAGIPVYTDFACAWSATVQALQGGAAALYDPAEFVKIQAALVGPRDYFYPNWPYPPTFFLILAPFTVLPYRYGFIAWDMATLLGLIVVVYCIVRKIAGGRPGTGVAVYDVELSRRAKRVSDRLSARRITAISRAAAGACRLVYRLADL